MWRAGYRDVSFGAAGDIEDSERGRLVWILCVYGDEEFSVWREAPVDAWAIFGLQFVSQDLLACGAGWIEGEKSLPPGYTICFAPSGGKGPRNAAP